MRTFSAAILTPHQTPPAGTTLVLFAEAGQPPIRARVREQMRALAADYAARHAVYVVPGLVIAENRLWLELLDPRGQVIFTQAATHRNPTWAADLLRADTLAVVDTPFARLGLCVDVDIDKPEVARILAMHGAQVLVSSQYLPAADDTRAMILAGPWQEAQQNCVYVLHSTPTQASILAPVEASPDRSGFLGGPTGQMPITAQLSAEARAAAYRAFPLFASLNPPLYRQHAAQLRR